MRILIILSCLAACGPSVREQRLHYCLESLRASQNSLAWMDNEIEAKARFAPITTATQQDLLRAYRDRRMFVVEAFMNAFAAVAGAALDDWAMPAAYDALKKLREEVRRLRAGEGR